MKAEDLPIPTQPKITNNETDTSEFQQKRKPTTGNNDEKQNKKQNNNSTSIHNGRDGRNAHSVSKDEQKHFSKNQ